MRQLKYMRAEAITLNYIEEMRNRWTSRLKVIDWSCLKPAMRIFGSKGVEISGWRKLCNEHLWFYSSKCYWNHQSNKDVAGTTITLYGRNKKCIGDFSWEIGSKESNRISRCTYSNGH
jgi:hypothetical protein